MRRSTLLIATAVLLALSCDNGIGPPATPQLSISFAFLPRTLNDGSRTGVLVTATVRHLGGPPVTFYMGCPSTPWLGLYDENGVMVPLGDPCGPLPACPAVRRKLEPGDQVRSGLLVNGLTYPNDCVPSTLPAGHYEVVAEFRYGEHGNDQVLVGSADLDWNPGHMPAVDPTQSP